MLIILLKVKTFLFLTNHANIYILERLSATREKDLGFKWLLITFLKENGIVINELKAYKLQLMAILRENLWKMKEAKSDNIFGTMDSTTQDSGNTTKSMALECGNRSKGTLTLAIGYKAKSKVLVCTFHQPGKSMKACSKTF